METELNDIINKCQDDLYLGFTRVEFSGLDWLNKVCGELSSLFRCLHKLLIFEIENNANAIEISLLCTSQIVCCIKYLEKALSHEFKDGIVLTPTRQFFLDRILWCLIRIKTIKDSSIVQHESDFVQLMDVALELISPLTLFATDSDISNIAKHHAEASIESAKIRSVVDSLIGQALAFVNVTSEEDKNPLTCMCQRVLRDSIAFEESCSLLKNNPDDQNRRLKAATLENAFYQLDKWMNDSLLRLVFAVFVKLKMDPIQKLREICENEKMQHQIDGQIEEIDHIFEKIVQIGNFALSFAWDWKTKCKLQSSLASLESLDSFLIPAILSHSKVHSELLQNHWNDEIAVLINCVQNIIDTEAFCGCIIEHLSNSIKTLAKSYDKHIISNLIFYCDVLAQHFQINYIELALGSESSRRLYFDDFVLMLKECKAALTLCKEDENNRIIKRFKILLSVLKKFQGTLKTDEPTRDAVLTFGDVTVPPSKFFIKTKLAKTDSMEVLTGATVTTEMFFERMGITPSPKKYLLYQSKREKSVAQSVAHRQIFTQINASVDSIKDCGEKNTSVTTHFTPSSRVKRRSSLRVALFKRSKENESKKIDDAYNNDTLGLHITDILEQITDLSNTLSHTQLQ